MLEGKNINLRPLKMSDWEKTIQWRNNVGLKKLAMSHPFPITDMLEKEWYENIIKSKNDKSVYFAVAKKDANLIGFITLNKISYIHRNCYLGVIIGENKEQGKGFGREAVELIIHYAFQTLNLNKITVEIVSNNKNSLSMFDRLGFIEEGRLKQQYYTGGKYFDIILLSVFRNLKY